IDSRYARYALFRAALEQPVLRSSDEVREFSQRVLKHFDDVRRGSATKDRPVLESMLESYLSVMTLAAPPPPSALREEEDKVIVGGVVVKKAGAR
ncbi:MAG: hypothetical protein AB1758_35470, partial [Candidatus Eremiobacterota bacterium]